MDPSRGSPTTINELLPVELLSTQNMDNFKASGHEELHIIMQFVDAVDHYANSII